MMISHVTDLQTGEVENVNYFNVINAWVQFQRYYGSQHHLK